jgi:trehalose 6-phosphate phosphatase
MTWWWWSGPIWWPGPGPPSGAASLALPALLLPLAHQRTASALFLDFDGTLSAIVEDPVGARPLPGVPDLLARLAAGLGLVAVISGRPTTFLSDVLEAPAGVRLVGLYGLELALQGEEAARWTKEVDDVVAQALSEAPDGVYVEPKGLTVTLNWRRAPRTSDWVSAFTEEQHLQRGFTAVRGRSSIELRPPVAVDKGTVVRALAGELPTPPGAVAVAVFGDDVGDLPAFEAVGDIGSETVVRVAAVDDETVPQLAAAADLTVGGAVGAVALLEELAQALG